jgi:hypothetical protein
MLKGERQKVWGGQVMVWLGWAQQRGSGESMLEEPGGHSG